MLEARHERDGYSVDGGGRGKKFHHFKSKKNLLSWDKRSRASQGELNNMKLMETENISSSSRTARDRAELVRFQSKAFTGCWRVESQDMYSGAEINVSNDFQQRPKANDLISRIFAEDLSKGIISVGGVVKFDFTSSTMREDGEDDNFQVSVK